MYGCLSNNSIQKMGAAEDGSKQLPHGWEHTCDGNPGLRGLASHEASLRMGYAYKNVLVRKTTRRRNVPLDLPHTAGDVRVPVRPVAIVHSTDTR
jgi:hypothetical protein